MFEQAERLQQSIWGRLFIVTVFPVLLVLVLISLTLLYFIVKPVAILTSLLLHGDANHYRRF